MKAMILCFMLLIVAPKCWSTDQCFEPNICYKEKIITNRFNEIKKWYSDSEEIIDISKDDITIIQSYIKDKYILAEHRFNCCFEGFVVLYELEDNGLLKIIATFNGYDNKGVFIGYNVELVKDYFKSNAPNNAKTMIDCWK